MTDYLTGKTLGIIHAAVFTAASLEPFAREILPGVEIMHAGDDTILRDNNRAPVGTIPKVNFYKFATFARFFEEGGVDLILLACSTFNQAIEYARPMINVPMLQIDKPMMEKAVSISNHITILGTLPATMPSSERLLRQCAAEAGKSININSVLNSHAFNLLRCGNVTAANEALLDDIDRLSKDRDYYELYRQKAAHGKAFYSKENNVKMWNNLYELAFQAVIDANSGDKKAQLEKKLK